MTASVKDLPEPQRAISERFRILGLRWADAEHAANLQERLRTATLSQIKTKLIDHSQGKMSEAKADRVARAGKAWDEYNRVMCDLRYEANKLKVQMEALRMRYGEWNSSDANQRHEARLSRG